MRKTVAIIRVLFLALTLCACSDSPKETPLREHSFFAQAWNSRAEKIIGGEKYLLQSDGKGIVRELKNFSSAFSTEWTPEQERELKALRKEALTSYHLYSDYKRANFRREPPSLSDNMTDQEIALTLNKWLGVKSGDRIPDYPAAETVRKIIFMNDFCAYFMNNRKEIHRKGVDTAINSCEEARAGTAYPWLDALIGRNIEEEP